MNYCRICEQDFASVEAFDYHLPPAQLLPREARFVHPDAVELAAWGLRRNARGQWTMFEGAFGSAQRVTLEPRGAIWPERLMEASLV
jgi:hypothetical protein